MSLLVVRSGLEMGLAISRRVAARLEGGGLGVDPDQCGLRSGLLLGGA